MTSISLLDKLMQKIFDILCFSHLNLPYFEVSFDNSEERLGIFRSGATKMAGDPRKGDLFDGLIIEEATILGIVGDDSFIKYSDDIVWLIRIV